MDYKVFLEGPGRVCRGISVRLIARPVLFCAGRRTRTTFQIKVGYLLAAHGFVLGSGEIGEGNWSPRVRVRREIVSPDRFPGICGAVLPTGPVKAFAGTRSVAQESGKENRSRDRAKATGRGGTQGSSLCLDGLFYTKYHLCRGSTHSAGSSRSLRVPISPKEMNFLPDFTCAHHPPQE